MPHIHEKYDFVVTLYIVYKKTVLLCRHPRYNIWIPVGGHIELDEDPEEALRREVKEETGLEKFVIMSTKPKVKAPGIAFIFRPNFVEIHEANPPHKHISLVYFVKAYSDEVKLSTEHSELRWFSARDLVSPELKLSDPVKYCCRQALRASKRQQD